MEKTSPDESLRAPFADVLDSASPTWKIGQMLAVGFPSGEEGFAVLERTLGRTLAGNLILFSRNGTDAAAASRSAHRGRALVRAATGTEPLVAIDQEGGKVARIRGGLTPLPGAMAQSAAFLGDSVTLAEVEALAEICGSELAELGVDWDLAPVADVNVNPANPVIGVRSYGEDPRLVAAMASAFARGLAGAGVIATAKHFPGHGDTSLDSHLDLPLVPHGFPRLDEVELLPFRRLIAEGIPAVMTAHVRFPAVEPAPLPATLSPRVLQGLLRRDLGFRGLICSDCMEMKAVADRYEDRFVMAVEAGVDLLFVSHRAEVQEEASASLLRALESGRVSLARIDESVARILALKRLIRSPGEAGGRKRPGPDFAAALSEKIALGSLSMLGAARRDGARRLPEGAVSVLLDCAPAAASAAEEEAAERPSVAEALAGIGPPIRSLRLPADPGPGEVEAALSGLEAGSSQSPKRGASASPKIALALSAPLRLPGQRLLLEKAFGLSSRNGESLLVVLMGSPYDLKGVLDLAERQGAPRPSVLCSYEYTASSASAAAAYLSGKAPALGRCPVSLPA